MMKMNGRYPSEAANPIEGRHIPTYSTILER